MVSVMVDLGLHQLQRLVDLLTVHECEELLMALSNPVENISNQLHSLSEETNQFRMIDRTTRDTGTKIVLLIFNKHLRYLKYRLEIHLFEELTALNVQDGLQLFEHYCACVCICVSDKKSHCHSVLIDWLQTNGEQMYYDRLSRTLQQIGRTDIAIG